jgi:hypothetical protein
MLIALLWSPGPPVAAEPASSPPISGDHPLSRAEAEESSLFALPTTHDHIGRVVVAAMVNGKGPFRFIVDTGATNSTVSPRLVHELGLQPTGAASIVLNGITGTAQVSAVTLDRLQAGDMTIDQLVAPVVWAPVMAGADGILGAAGLTGRSLSVDFERNYVRISRGVEMGVRAEALKIHATRVTHGLITLSMQVGRVHGLAVIDTGSERTLGNPALQAALKLRNRTGAEALVTSVYGATEQGADHPHRYHANQQCPGRLRRLPHLQGVADAGHARHDRRHGHPGHRQLPRYRFQERGSLFHQLTNQHHDLHAGWQPFQHAAAQIDILHLHRSR